MIYDQHSDMSEIHAPVETRIVIRSKSKNNSKDDVFPASTSSLRASNQRNYTSSTSGQRIDIGKFTQRLQNVTARTSSQKCAKSIRLALESAGARFNSHPVAAADWGGTLTKIGYKKIPVSFDNPKKGDIYIIHRTNSHVYGHIAGYTGSNWVSDFRQAGYAVYRNENVNYSYYRMQD
ncbi:peptidoglycan amidohydrolase family protein [Acinetobacter lanii]|uniref:CHAP domain-containing protein n=1 Tax=Acinetobacter lanii TaxID=2715163 RepID=A0A6G8S7C5_9GAMM|nr:peptidoglycan amidohydrolase family protein [Acinetobacter lanii]QIO09843.1 CHAP domain-containing protein [Acinetobacter lanii]